jgi:hypothetical protein
VTLANHAAQSSPIRLRHHNVGDNEVNRRVCLSNQGEGLAGTGGLKGAVPGSPEHSPDYLQCEWFIVHTSTHARAANVGILPPRFRSTCDRAPPGPGFTTLG